MVDTTVVHNRHNTLLPRSLVQIVSPEGALTIILVCAPGINGHEIILVVGVGRVVVLKFVLGRRDNLACLVCA
jgi:hypothetical protein